METAFPRDMFEYEEDFRKFRKLCLAEIEDGFQQERENIEAQQEVEARVSEQIRQLMKESGLDINRVNAIEEGEAKKLDEYLARVRAPLIERDPQFDTRLRQELEFKLSHTHAGSSQAHLIGADVIALDPEWLASYEGEMGNPAKWLFDAKKNWKGKISHYGSPGCSGGTPYHPAGTLWYYIWTPPKSGQYSILSGTYYHGFYAIYSAFSPWSACSYARVHAKTELRIGVKKPYSKYPVGIAQDVRDIFKKEGSSIIATGALEGSAVHSSSINYTGTGPLYINVLVSLSVTAKGSPTYAELNFEDGAANYVSPPFVIISWT